MHNKIIIIATALKDKVVDMFRRNDTNLPEDVGWPTNLAELGFKLNDKGQFVKIRKDGDIGSDEAEGKPVEVFDFYGSDSERSNEMRKEAMHRCAKQEMIRELEELGVKQLYLNGQAFREVKPEGPHVIILTTQLDELKDKKDVIVVVNEHKQDLGVWAYRTLMREGGM